MKKNINIYLMVGLGYLSSSSMVQAFQVQNTMQVTASVASSCTMSGMTNMSFGAYVGTQVSSSATFNVNCSTGTAYTIGITAGGSGNVQARQMSNVTTPTSKLNYVISSDAPGANIWGITVGTNTVAGTGTGSNQAISIYGTVAANQAPASIGNYSDSVLVQVNY